ncbi:hypothetical protein GQ457_09G019110 [Hibiscus cannabinus]
MSQHTTQGSSTRSKVVRFWVINPKGSKVWTLVDRPHDKSTRGTKWVFRNKLDESSNIVRNKARLVAQGYTQEEGNDFDETYAPIARMEAIRMLLAFACHHEIKLFQMDVKVDTLFIKTKEEDILVVQIYVDDIIFGSTNESLCQEFAKLMQGEFEMSMIGELSFFLGLQIKQMKHETFINQAKYNKEKLKKFGLENVKPQVTHMISSSKLDKDEGGKCIDSKLYRSMIGSLLYLTESRPDIMFSVCLCAIFQDNPKESHLKVVKRIFRYLKDTPSLGLWYPRDSTFDLHAYSDADYGGCKIDKKSTYGTCQFLGNMHISWFSKKQNSVALSTTEVEYISVGSCCAQVLWMKQQLFYMELITALSHIFEKLKIDFSIDLAIPLTEPISGKSLRKAKFTLFNGEWVHNADLPHDVPPANVEDALQAPISPPPPTFSRDPIMQYLDGKFASLVTHMDEKFATFNTRLQALETCQSSLDLTLNAFRGEWHGHNLGPQVMDEDEEEKDEENNDEDIP